MSLYRRRRMWWTDLRYKGKGWPRIQVSTGTSVKGIARELEGTLKALIAKGRRDLVDQIRDGRLALADVHDLYHRDREALEQRAQREASPELGPLVDEWLGWLESPEAISPRTRAHYAPNTIRRYRMSFATIFETAPEGRALKLQGLTRGFFLDLRATRIKAGAKGVTVNRDLVAVSAFLRWCEEVKGLTVPRLTLPREKENAGRDRWLSADELAQLYIELPAEWVALFTLLASTGLRIAEALSLTWQDVRFADRTIRVRGQGVETTKGHRRVVPMGQALARTLAKHREAVPAGVSDPVFPRAGGPGRSPRRWPSTLLIAGCRPASRPRGEAARLASHGGPRPQAYVCRSRTGQWYPPGPCATVARPPDAGDDSPVCAARTRASR